MGDLSLALYIWEIEGTLPLQNAIKNTKYILPKKKAFDKLYGKNTIRNI